MSERVESKVPVADIVGETGYDPIGNTGLAEIVSGTQYDSEESLRLLDFSSDVHKIGNRVLHIVYDNVVGMAPDEDSDLILSRINGDAIFVLNALLAQRVAFQSMRQLADFESGFRAKTKHPEEELKNIPTYFGRAVQALDNIAEKSTGRILIARTSWGSGAQKGNIPPMYKIHDDTTVLDTRNLQR